MAYVNVGTAITKALTKLPAGVDRTPFVTWFNEIVKDIMNQPRQWAFLDEPLTLPIVNNQITLPATVSEISSIEVGIHFFTQSDQLSEEEATRIDTAESTILDYSEVFVELHPGYTLSAANVITFHPSLTGTAEVIAEKSVTADYTDGISTIGGALLNPNPTTIFPKDFENLFIIGLRMNYYDTHKDGRFSKESILYQMEMSKMRAWDNRRKPLAHFTRHGYTRG